jgi:hypothetical protein
MRVHAPTSTLPSVRRLLFGALLATFIPIVAPASSRAAISTFGSPLSMPATLNTAVNLSYRGTNTAVPPNPEAPNGLYHTYHYGADAALWNTSLSRGAASAPAAGQAVKVSLEGCADAAPGGLAPLTQIHFQDISPMPGGGAKVNLTSQPFDIPVCGQNGAGGSTVTTYEPINLCVSPGDYVAFNEEGGFVEHTYQNGVPYQVLGSVQGSASDSFIRGNGTGNGAPLSALDTTAMDGFAANQNEELMLQVTLGTGPDAVPACGGKRGVPPPLAPMRVSPQTDGVNHSGVVSVAVFCRVAPECKGTATLSTHAGRDIYGHSNFSLVPHTTVHLPIHVSSQLVKMIRSKHGVSTTLTMALGGATISQRITLKIF